MIRDKLYRMTGLVTRWRLVAVAIAIAIIAIIGTAYLHSSWDALKLMAGTIYPGHRRHNGGTFKFWQLFAGTYNLLTIYTGYHGTNPSEASSFYLFFPVPVLMFCFSKRWRNHSQVLDWILIGYLAVLIVYLKLGLPHSIAAIILMNRSWPDRANLVVGLISILLTVRGLQTALTFANSQTPGLEKVIQIIAVALTLALSVGAGLAVAAVNGGSPPAQLILFASLVAAYTAYCLVAGRARTFGVIVGIVVLTTVSVFNTLSTDLDYIYKSEMSRAIQGLNTPSERPLWVCYAPDFSLDPGLLVPILGGPSVSGLQWPPPLEFWHALDPQKQFETSYNNFQNSHLSISLTRGLSVSSKSGKS